MLAALSLVLVYITHYEGGDMFSYYFSAVCTINLAFENFENFLKVILETPGPHTLNLYTQNTGIPPSDIMLNRFTQPTIFITIPLVFLSMNSFLGTSVLTSILTGFAHWHLYKKLLSLFPGINPVVIMLFIFTLPNLIWTSGILKDAYMQIALSILTITLIKMKYEGRWLSITVLISFLLSYYYIFMTRTYVAYALIPAIVFFFFFDLVRKVRPVWAGVLIYILFAGIFIGGAGMIIYEMGDLLWKYNP